MAISTISFANTMRLNDRFNEPAVTIKDIRKHGWFDATHMIGSDFEGDYYLRAVEDSLITEVKIAGRPNIYTPVHFRKSSRRNSSSTYSAFEQNMFIDFSDSDKKFIENNDRFDLIIVYGYERREPYRLRFKR